MSIRLGEMRWMENISPMPECDFCHEDIGTKSYGCRKFEYEGNRVLGGENVNLLLACAECSWLIEASAWHDLTDRVFEVFLQRNGARRKESLPVRMRIEEIHEMLREHIVCAGHT